MGIFSALGNALDNFNDWAEDYIDDDRKKPLAKRDPEGMSEGQLEVMKSVQFADEKSRMEEVLEFAKSIGNIRMARKLQNRINVGAFEYKDILQDFGYEEIDVDDYLLSDDE